MIYVTIPKNTKDGIVNNQKESWNFQFDKILHNVPQEDVFEYCVTDIIKSSVKGYNGTIFAYGQTGSGKTFTISGAPSNFNYRGIIPRAITRLFQEISQKPEYEFKVQISYLEIYNEVIYDLLASSSGTPKFNEGSTISFQEDAKGNLVVKGLSMHTVTNEEEAFNVLFEGESNRTISEHQLNKASTRSHCLFTVHLEMKSRIESTEKVIFSKLNFVDLAGSERVKKTGSTGITLKEATYINKSLTFLEQVVVALTERKTKNKEHVPYRQSKLTHILKDSIGGNCKTVMVATVWPEEQFIQETLSTLNFAKRMKNVVNEMTVNIQMDNNALIRKMTKEIKELKQELAMHNTLANRGRINYDPYSPQEQVEQQNIAKKYLIGESEEIEFDSVRQAKELFYQIRYLYQKIKTIGAKKYANQIQAETGGVDKKDDKEKLAIDLTEKDIDKKEEPKDKKSILKDKKEEEKEKEKEVIKEGDENQGEVPENKEEEIPDEEQKKLEEALNLPPGRIPDKNSAFVIYKHESDYSKKTEESMKQSTSDLKTKRNKARELLEKSNDLKKKLEEIKKLLNDKKLNKLNLADEMTNVIDDEECKLISELKDTRGEYKKVVDNFNILKNDITNLKENLELTKIRYVEDFENWFLKKYGIKIEEHELRLAKAKYGVNVEEEKAVEKTYEPDEQAYMNAKKKVQTIHKAKKMQNK